MKNGSSNVRGDDSDSPTLRSFIEANGPQSEDIVLNWFHKLVDSLKRLHSRSSAANHGSLSPDTIVLTNGGLPAILDARVLPGINQRTAVLQQYYQAPEQADGRPVPASDVYSIAATMLFSLTGRDPCPNPSDSHRCKPRSISADLTELIDLCMRREPHARPADASQLKILIDRLMLSRLLRAGRNSSIKSTH